MAKNKNKKNGLNRLTDSCKGEGNSERNSFFKKKLPKNEKPKSPGVDINSARCIYIYVGNVFDFRVDTSQTRWHRHTTNTKKDYIIIINSVRYNNAITGNAYRPLCNIVKTTHLLFGNFES